MNEVKASVGLEGRFRLTATKRDGSHRSTGWFDNLILNNGLNVMGSGNPISQCMVGTGNTAPAVTDTQLQTRIASTTNIVSATHGVDLTDNFAEGVATGDLQEVGVGNSNTSCFSRALIQDTLGDPTVFPVAADETLDVQYELRVYPKVTDTVTTITLDGIDYEFTIRPQTFNLWDWSFYVRFLNSLGMRVLGWTGPTSYGVVSSFGTYVQAIAGTSQNGGTHETVSYVNGSHEVIRTHIWGLTAGNVDIEGFMVTTACGYWKMLVDPPIPKRSTKILTLNFKLSWARR
jgi:hypothetical protein